MTPATPTATPLSPAQILRWYADMGVDIAIDDAPHDRFAECVALARKAVAQPEPLQAQIAAEPDSERPRRAALPSRQRSSAALPPPAPATGQNERAGSRLAEAAQDLGALRAALLAYDGCGLKATATQLVFADGNPQARIMLVGEAPGADEDRTGLPFSGRAGRLLDAMLAAIGLDRSSAYLAYVVPWRPPGNQTPSPLVMGQCLPFITRQIKLASPDILVCIGGSTAQALLKLRDGILQTRGKWHDYACGTKTIQAIAMLHPDHLLLHPKQKRLAWKDLREIRTALGTG